MKTHCSQQTLNNAFNLWICDSKTLANINNYVTIRFLLLWQAKKCTLQRDAFDKSELKKNFMSKLLKHPVSIKISRSRTSNATVRNHTLYEKMCI